MPTKFGPMWILQNWPDYSRNIQQVRSTKNVLKPHQIQQPILNVRTQIFFFTKIFTSCRGGFQACKNYKYFKKHKLNIEFQSFFLFDILLPEIHFDIKMLYNFVNSNMYKMFGQKNIHFLNNCMNSNSKCRGAYFCILI